MASIGIMDPAFFVGKTVLLDWCNEFFETNVQKVEEFASGAMHCQILDCIFPGKVPIKKVNFNAKHEYEYIQNFKVLQNLFVKENIPKHVPVEKLVKAKYQDNLEFLQWMKNFFETRYSGQEYHAAERRAFAMGKKKATGIGMKPKKAASKAAEEDVAKPAASTKAAPKPKAAAPAKEAAPKKTATTKPKTATKGTTRAAGASGADRLAKLNEELAKLRVTTEGLEKERNFYFGKLREVEVLCQADEEVDKEVKESVLAVLYKTDDDDEFQAPATEEEEAAEGEEGGEEEEAGEEEAAEEEVAEDETF